MYNLLFTNIISVNTFRNYDFNDFDASLTSSAFMVFLPACFDISIAFFAISPAISSMTLRNSFADSSLILLAPAFLSILYIADNPNSDDFIKIAFCFNNKRYSVKKFTTKQSIYTDYFIDS